MRRLSGYILLCLQLIVVWFPFNKVHVNQCSKQYFWRASISYASTKWFSQCGLVRWPPNVLKIVYKLIQHWYRIGSQAFHFYPKQKLVDHLFIFSSENCDTDLHSKYLNDNPSLCSNSLSWIEIFRKLINYL